MRSPDGYDTPGQVSSAYDLAVFGAGRAAQRGLRASTAARPGPVPRDGGGRSYEIQNTNRLLSGANGVERYRGMIGVKNGYTSNAGNTLVAAARRGGRTLVVTVMNPQEGGGLAVYEEAAHCSTGGSGPPDASIRWARWTRARSVSQAGPEALGAGAGAGGRPRDVDSGPGGPRRTIVAARRPRCAGAVSLGCGSWA